MTDKEKNELGFFILGSILSCALGAGMIWGIGYGFLTAGGISILLIGIEMARGRL